MTDLRETGGQASDDPARLLVALLVRQAAQDELPRRRAEQQAQRAREDEQRRAAADAARVVGRVAAAGRNRWLLSLAPFFGGLILAATHSGAALIVGFVLCVIAPAIVAGRLSRIADRTASVWNWTCGLFALYWFLFAIGAVIAVEATGGG